MSALRNLVDKIKPTFTKGGKLGFLESTFDAFETFLFVPNTTTQKGAHIRDCNDMKRTMIMVVVALMPALLFGFYNTGYLHFLSQGVQPEFWASLWFGFLKVLPIIVVSYVVGLGIEFAFAQARGHEVNEGFLVTGPADPDGHAGGHPAVDGGAGHGLLGHLRQGGVRRYGYERLQPRAAGPRLRVLRLYALDVGRYGVDRRALLGRGRGGRLLGATALENLSTTGQMGYSAMDAFLGFIPGCIGETSTLAILLGAAILLFTGVASWRTMVSVFVGGLAMGYFFQAIGTTTYPAWYHLIIGGFAFGAVFMATDPVTSAQTNTGKYIVGLLTGALAVLIRVVNPAYPEGMMLSILFMNALAPLVDYYVVEANISRRKKRVKLAK